MMRIRRSYTRFPLAIALALGGQLALVPAVVAAATVRPDVPSPGAVPAPRSVHGQIKLAGDYFAGRGVAQDLRRAAFWYEKAAGAGDPLAELQIGYFYQAGIGVPKDAVRAAHWYQIAAADGLVDAKVSLALAYLWGTGVEKNQELAVHLFHEAAGEGSGLAACYLGEMYDLGTGVPQDKAAAEQWYVKGAKLHNAKAEFNLGSLLFTGKAREHDLAKAANLLRESAASGYVPAMHLLGVLLVRNPDRARSPQEAVALLNHAASAGVWQSAMFLGLLARDGNGVTADKAAAYYHLRTAVLQGGERAENLLDPDLRMLAAKLDPAQVSALDQQASKWHQDHQVVLEFTGSERDNRIGFPSSALAVPEKGAHAGQIIPTLPN